VERLLYQIYGGNLHDEFLVAMGLGGLKMYNIANIYLCYSKVN
jgi:hypothetical protein